MNFELQTNIMISMDSLRHEFRVRIEAHSWNKCQPEPFASGAQVFVPSADARAYRTVSGASQFE